MDKLPENVDERSSGAPKNALEKTYDHHSPCSDIEIREAMSAATTAQVNPICLLRRLVMLRVLMQAAKI